MAIKVLPAHVASDPDLRQRFEREAKTISSLNHPHICTLYEFDTQDGTDFLVMEYLEGETLAQRLTKGALPLDQALRYAIEIADALDKAHRQGATHRDLKPANIMLTKTGAKLLDFGLAKLQRSDVKAELATLASTRIQEQPLTEKGTVLGTVQYMAPERRGPERSCSPSRMVTTLRPDAGPWERAKPVATATGSSTPRPFSRSPKATWGRPVWYPTHACTLTGN